MMADHTMEVPVPVPMPLTASPTRSETELLVAFTRLEGKVDTALAQHGADIATHTREIKDHEDRLRKLEMTPTVSPRTLWTVAASAIALILAAGPVIARLFI